MPGSKMKKGKAYNPSGCKMAPTRLVTCSDSKTLLPTPCRPSASPIDNYILAICKLTSYSAGCMAYPYRARQALEVEALRQGRDGYHIALDLAANRCHHRFVRPLLPSQQLHLALHLQVLGHLEDAVAAGLQGKRGTRCVPFKSRHTSSAWEGL